MYTSRSRAHAASSKQTLKLFQVKDAEEEEEEEPEHDGTGGANHNKYCHFCQHVKVSPPPLLPPPLLLPIHLYLLMFQISLVCAMGAGSPHDTARTHQL